MRARVRRPRGLRVGVALGCSPRVYDIAGTYNNVCPRRRLPRVCYPKNYTCTR